MDTPTLLTRLRGIRHTSHGYMQPKDSDELSAIIGELEAEAAETAPAEIAHEAPLNPPDEPAAQAGDDEEDEQAP